MDKKIKTDGEITLCEYPGFRRRAVLCEKKIEIIDELRCSEKKRWEYALSNFLDVQDIQKLFNWLKEIDNFNKLMR